MYYSMANGEKMLLVCLGALYRDGPYPRRKPPRSDLLP
jgi:hypothetical protein